MTDNEHYESIGDEIALRDQEIDRLNDEVKRAEYSRKLWKMRFDWLINQHWVEAEVPDNLEIQYEDGDEYRERLIFAIDYSLEDEGIHTF